MIVNNQKYDEDTANDTYRTNEISSANQKVKRNKTGVWDRFIQELRFWLQFEKKKCS